LYGKKSGEHPCPSKCLNRSCTFSKPFEQVLSFKAVSTCLFGAGSIHSGGRYFSENCQTNQWIGLRENLQETSIFNGKNHGFLQIFPQSNDRNQGIQDLRTPEPVGSMDAIGDAALQSSFGKASPASLMPRESTNY